MITARGLVQTFSTRQGRAKVDVRAVVVGGIQEAIDRAGNLLGFEARIVLSGLLSDADLDAAERALQDGSESLVDLTRLAYGRRTED